LQAVQRDATSDDFSLTTDLEFLLMTIPSPDARAPVWIEAAVDGADVFVLRWTDEAGAALGLDREVDVRIHAGAGGRDAAEAHVRMLLDRLAIVTEGGA
jgi:hypothetical protein